MAIKAINPYITPASPVVVEQITRLNKKADKLEILANKGIEGLFGFNLQNVDLDPKTYYSEADLESLLAKLGALPDFDQNTDWLNGLSLSGDNSLFVFNPELLQYLRQMLPEYNIPPLEEGPPAPERPPEFVEGPEPQAPERPTLPTYQAPDVDVDVELPAYEDFTAGVPFPVLRPINLPQAPSINIDDITFEGRRPNFDLATPDAGDFVFTDKAYEGQVFEQTKAKILEIFDGSTGLPAAVEDAIFERAREREVELGEREVQQARDEWGARGWQRPPGMLAAATRRARTDASNKVSQLNRDQFIERNKMQLDMLRDALTQAMALEDLWGRIHMSAEDRRLQASRMKLDLTIQVFQAGIARFQAEGQMFAIDAQVFNQKFMAEQAKLQLFSEQLRAQSMVGDLNEQDVRIFAQRIGALQANAEIYRARVAGYSAVQEAVEKRVTLFRAQLEANNTLIAGYEADVRAFGTAQQAVATRAERYRTRATIYASDVQAHRDRIQTLIESQNQHFKRAELTRDTFSSNTDRIRAFIQGEEGRIGALRDKYASRASEIASKSESERTRYQLMLAIAQANLARYESAANILMKNGEISIQSAMQAEGLMLRAQETATTTLAQMSAGYTSAANVSAGIDDRSSSSLSYNFEGELDIR